MTSSLWLESFAHECLVLCNSSEWRHSNYDIISVKGNCLYIEQRIIWITVNPLDSVDSDILSWKKIGWGLIVAKWWVVGTSRLVCAEHLKGDWLSGSLRMGLFVSFCKISTGPLEWIYHSWTMPSREPFPGRKPMSMHRNLSFLPLLVVQCVLKDLMKWKD